MGTKKVYLIKVPHEYHVHDRNWPLGLLYINSYLRGAGVDSSIIDLSGRPEEEWDLPLDGDCYGISCTTPDYHHARRIAEKLRDRTSALLVLGGVHATARPEEVLQTSVFDVVVRGEGEETMAELVRSQDFSGIAGISYRGRDRMVVHTPPRKLVEELDTLPAPDIRDIDYQAYIQPIIIKDPGSHGVAMITARGCPFQCIFCASAKMWHRQVRFHSVPYILRQVEVAMGLGVRHIFFCDDTLLIDRSRTGSLLQEIRKLDITWRCSATTGSLTPELVAAMAASGCRQIDFGIESGSDRMLRIMKKSSRRQEHEAAIRMAREAGIMTKSMLMVGLPGETEEDVLQTVDFVRKNDSDLYALTAFVPLPGCDVAEHMEKYDFAIDPAMSYDNFFIVGKDKKTPIIHRDKETITRWRDLIWEAIGEKATLDVIYARAPKGNEACHV